MTLSGKLLPTVFICLQEANGNFGPRVQISVDEYAKIYTNVAITSSKSGKLTTALYKDFLIDVMKPYVKEEKFLFLIDSWGGQTNPVLYDEIFTDDKGIPTCTMKIMTSDYCNGIHFQQFPETYATKKHAEVVEDESLDKQNWLMSQAVPRVFQSQVRFLSTKHETTSPSFHAPLKSHLRRSCDIARAKKEARFNKTFPQAELRKLEQAESEAAHRAAETLEQSQARRRRHAEYLASQRAAETPEQSQARRLQHATYSERYRNR
ncbi:HTH CENPB-type domain-containing protein [Trichonephila clavipes]|nr:HTH CENPB-type domain-containing protein [Trichonephila clavipes]